MINKNDLLFKTALDIVKSLIPVLLNGQTKIRSIDQLIDVSFYMAKRLIRKWEEEHKDE